MSKFINAARTVHSEMANVCPLQPHQLHGKGAQGFYGPVTLGNCKLPSNSPSTVKTLILIQVDKRDDPYAPQKQGGCCVVM
jgi:hypothetical protein